VVQEPIEPGPSDRFGAASLLLTASLFLTALAVLVILGGTLWVGPSPPEVPVEGASWRQPVLFPAAHSGRSLHGSASRASDFVPGLDSRVPPEELLVLEGR
jgi:hypothetical protein